VAGPGLLSPLLARLRYRRAELLIAEEHRGGRILDVGCGSWPAFLVSTRFAEKHGIDRREPAAAPPEGVQLHRFDVARRGLGFPDGHFDVVTLLAVVEHLAPDVARSLLSETRRVLRRGGVAVLTVPSRQAEAVLSVMAKLGLASAEQHEEHQAAYDPARLRSLLAGAGFDAAAIEVGRFELGMNLWARARA
jgi:SAM-dependent methyltransferase